MKAPAESTLKVHEIAACFPDMTEPEYRALKAGIARSGQREPIWTYQGRIVDGRHRHRACRELGREPCIREWDGEGSLLDLVLDLNCHRRHLDTSQRAMVAANLANLKPGRPGRPGRRAQICAISVADAATRLRVSERLVQDASKVKERGEPGLVESVARGDVKVTAAAAVAGLGAEQQAEVIAGGAPAIVAKAAEIRREKKARSAGGPDPGRPPSIEAPGPPPDAGPTLPAGCPEDRPDPAEVEVEGEDEGEGRPDPEEVEDAVTVETQEDLLNLLVIPLKQFRRHHLDPATDRGKFRRLWLATQAGRAHLAGLLTADRFCRVSLCWKCLGSGSFVLDRPCPDCKATGLTLLAGPRG